MRKTYCQDKRTYSHASYASTQGPLFHLLCSCLLIVFLQLPLLTLHFVLMYEFSPRQFPTLPLAAAGMRPKPALKVMSR
jgi:hypothetical protein